jgi:hypothetical protein
MKPLNWIFALLFCLVVTPAFSQPSGGNPAPPFQDVSIDQRDYQGNLTATDRFRAPATQPAIEYPAAPEVHHAVYLKGQNIVVKVRWRNWHSFAVWGTWTLQDAKLEVPKPGKQVGTDN